MALSLTPSKVIDENTDTITCTLTNLTSSNYGDLSNHPIKCRWSITTPKNNTIKWAIGGVKHNITDKPTTDVNNGTTSITINGENISTSVLEKLTITATPIINKDSNTIDLSPEKTDNISVGNSLNYYWYIGQTMPDSVDPSTWRSSSKDAGFTETVDILAGDTYLVIPNYWSYSAKDSSGDDFAFNAFVKPSDKTKIDGYVIYKIVMNGTDKVTITFSK
jgi:hypothetical protein